jgi:hypothetical protein
MTINTTNTATIPAPKNFDWGFYGILNEQAEAAWPIAVTAISKATGQTLESAATFLDSRHGRHFADDVLNGLHTTGGTMADAIKAAVKQWINWTVSRADHKEYGIPAGMPLLLGFVIHCGICKEI